LSDSVSIETDFMFLALVLAARSFPARIPNRRISLRIFMLVRNPIAGSGREDGF
jgi:hypothetical protein